MIIVDAAGSIWIDKDVEVDKGICGTTPLSPSPTSLHSFYPNLVTITNVNHTTISPTNNIMSILSLLNL